MICKVLPTYLVLELFIYGAVAASISDDHCTLDWRDFLLARDKLAQETSCYYEQFRLFHGHASAEQLGLQGQLAAVAIQIIKLSNYRCPVSSVD